MSINTYAKSIHMLSPSIHIGSPSSFIALGECIKSWCSSYLLWLVVSFLMTMSRTVPEEMTQLSTGEEVVIVALTWVASIAFVALQPIVVLSLWLLVEV